MTIRLNFWGLAALAGLAMTGTSAVAQQAAAGGPSGTLTIAVAQDPSTLDPQMHRVRFSQTIAHVQRDSLFYQKPPGLAFAPLLAESITRIDDTHYEAKLHEGVHFHGGDELTADDVVYTFHRLWDPANKSPRATMGNMANVEKIEAVGRYTVRWTTKVPFGTAEQAIPLLGLNNQQILHKAFYEKLTLEEARTSPGDGAGPFQLVEWVPEQRLVMKAFHDYWQGPPKVENLIWRTIPEETTRTAELLAGSVDIIYPVTPDFVDQLKSAGMKLDIEAGTSARMLQMNVREGSPFADVEVRKAMNMAIDKEAITQNLYGGLAIPFEQVPGVGQEGNIEGYDPFPYDPDAARAVLSKVTQPIELFTAEQEQLAAEAIAEQLRGYGMKVTTVVVDTATLDQRNNDGNFDLMLFSAGYASGEFIGTYYSNNFACSRLDSDQVRTGFCNEDLDKLATAVQAEGDPQKHQQMLEEVTRKLSSEFVPWVPLFGPAEVWAMQPYVHGFVGSSVGQWFDLQNVSVDK
jgi:peptide/nickel transport system substrate-binding protein